MAHILILDDDADALKLMAKILTTAGHTVTACSSGDETVKKLGIAPDDADVEPPDLIVLDIMMPKLDGYVIGRLIRHNPRTRSVPILVVSALREMSRLFTATVHIDGFLNKPFEPKDLVASVARILKPPKPAG